MEVDSTPQIVEDFFKNMKESENYLSQYGESGKDKNNGVSLSYENIAKQSPLFIWFSAATLGSIQVGKTIRLIDNPILAHCDSTSTLSLGFSSGNQDIHNNIVALYHTYQDYGINGLEKLEKWDSLSIYTSSQVTDAFRIYSQLEAQANNYAKEVNLPANDLSVIHHVMNQDNNLQLLKSATKSLVEHEQNIVQPMYHKMYFDGGKTVGETLNDSTYLEKLVANQIEIAGAKILDKYISTDGFDFTFYDQRMAYFDKVFNEYFNILAQEGGLERLIDQRDTMVASLDTDFIAYGQHFHEPEHLSFSIADNSEIISSENYAFTWDSGNQQWRHISNTDTTKHPGGFWVSPDTYPEVMNFVEKFPLMENTFYYDSNSNQPYLFCSADFLPNLPPNYAWISLKTYLQPSGYSYENGGSLWVPIKNITNPALVDAGESSNIPNKLNLADILDLFDDSLGNLIESLPTYETQHAQNTGSSSIAASDTLVSHISPVPEHIPEMV